MKKLSHHLKQQFQRWYRHLMCEINENKGEICMKVNWKCVNKIKKGATKCEWGRKDESDIAFEYLHTSSHGNEQHNQLKFTWKKEKSSMKFWEWVFNP